MREIKLFNINTGECLTFDENDVKGIANLLIDLLISSTNEILEEVSQAVNDNYHLYDDDGEEIVFSFKKFLRKNEG